MKRVVNCRGSVNDALSIRQQESRKCLVSRHAVGGRREERELRDPVKEA
jgi:hypothetical protein